MVTVGEHIPSFSVAATGDQIIESEQLRGRATVLYFYPRANTPGCTQESQDFRDLYAEFQQAGAEVIGISRDSMKAQENFKAKHDLPFALISDSDEQVCKLFDVIKEKNMYGKKVMGIERSTFLFDSEGVLRREWRKVKVPGHAAEVLEAAREL